MAGGKEKKNRETIVNFYCANKEKGKAFTFSRFKKEGVAKSTVYSILKTFEERKTVERKPGSGRRCAKLTPPVKKRLLKAACDKKGVSCRKLAGKFNVDPSHVCRVLRKEGVSFHKRRKAPANKPGQEEKQQKRCRKLSRDIFPAKSATKIVMDDESYFCLKGDNMPCNSGFYTRDKENTPPSVKYRFQEKYPTKVLVWAAVSEEGVSDVFFMPSRGCIDGETYRRECVEKRLLPFIQEHHADGDYVFWPDLASAHYAHATLELLQEHNVPFVPKEANPPNMPQLRPVENFWGVLKQAVYANGWEAETTAQLKRKIKKCAREFDIGSLQASFQGLKTKIRRAADKGGLSVLN